MKRGLLYGLLLGAVAGSGFAADGNIFLYKLGDLEVYTLVENRGPGRPNVLIGADRAALDKYARGGNYQSETNTFLIRGPNQIVLVDTGFGTTLFESLKTLGVSPDRIDAVLITHLHGDHFGGLQKNGRPLFPRAKVYLAQQEREYWTKTSVNQGAVDALAPYGSKVETFLPGELGSKIQELLPGITPIAAFGHTPGHTLFMVESSGRKLLVWGDLMHAELIQFPLPDVSVTYDTDPAAAAAVRRRVLEYAAADKIPVAGMHLVYPAIGSVSGDGNGYRLTQAE
ncbi:MAG: MBL fold metallo-hydrolase [Treponema sp.]|jgi:glyoxylase-like metal-dependent hydrolase (beta-lactamase superfamily II)|nr:MBL fold metallo-hydrolase [Treponema sp.]